MSSPENLIALQKVLDLLEKHHVQTGNIYTKSLSCCSGCKLEEECNRFDDDNTCDVSHVLRYFHQNCSDNVREITKAIPKSLHILVEEAVRDFPSSVKRCM